MSRTSKLAITSFAFIFIASCGGGGGGGGSTAANPTTLNFTVATGAPVVGASITIVDAAGNSQTCPSTSDSNGKVGCPLTTANTPPYMIKAQQESASIYAVVPPGAGNINVTPISDAMAQTYAANNNLVPAQVFAKPSNFSGATANGVQSAIDVVNNSFSTIAQKTAGVTITNALTQTYTPSSSSDALDSVIRGISTTTSSSGITFNVPTTSTTVPINIAYSASSSSATSIASTAATGLTASVDDGAQIDTLLTRAYSDLSSCSADSQTDLVSLVQGNLNSGRTAAQYFAYLCSQGLGTFTVNYKKNIAKFGNYSVHIVGIKSTALGNVEQPMVLSKSSGSWKWVADDSSFDISSIQLNEYLNFTFSGTSANPVNTITFARSIDFNVPASPNPPNASLATAKIFAIPVTQAASNFNSTFLSNDSNADLSLFIDYASCHNVLQLDITSGNCSGVGVTGVSDITFPKLFTKLGTAGYSLIVMKQEDSLGNCLNCEPTSGLPLSITVVGKSLTAADIFGSTATAAQLTSGITSMSADFEVYARTYFPFPNIQDLNSLGASLLGTSMGSSLNVPWILPTINNAQINYLDGGITNCANTTTEGMGGVGYPSPNPSITTNTYTYPINGKTFNNAKSILIRLEGLYNLNSYQTWIQVDRTGICTN